VRREALVDDARRPAHERPDPHAAELVDRFIAAVEEGEIEALLEMLAEDVEVVGDSGGNVPPGLAVSKPVSGREAVARLLVGFRRRGAPGYLQPATVNGRPGMVAYADESLGGGLIGTYAIDVSGGRITHLRGVVNPDKLRHLGRLADLDAIAAALKDAGRRRRAAGAAPGA
jgi:RNA polymerase sigma-70 factor (ECF subfamily)